MRGRAHELPADDLACEPPKVPYIAAGRLYSAGGDATSLVICWRAGSEGSYRQTATASARLSTIAVVGTSIRESEGVG